ncbi:hypothetical protein PR048_032449 [Dryococelus australis]|uniref:Uncharacterized protein n=1 Tax=Dryococelus australis TaxID=614101 RepID=A0ABQ9G283_9NEOP|nr:hypothetical protein PR048_032449 [Dryococelus australis]
MNKSFGHRLIFGTTMDERLGCSPPKPRRTEFNPRPVHSGFSQVGIVPDDTAGRRVFSGISRFPRPFIPALLHTYLTSPSSHSEVGSRLLALRVGRIPVGTPASKVKKRGSDTGDTNTHAYRLIAPTRNTCRVSVVTLRRRVQRPCAAERPDRRGVVLKTRWRGTSHDIHYLSESNWAPVHNVCSVVVTPLESRRATSCLYNSSHPVRHALYECLQAIHGDSSPFLLQPFHELSNGFWPRLTSPHPAIQFVPKMFYRVEVGALGGPVQSASIVVGRVARTSTPPPPISDYVQVTESCDRHQLRATPRSCEVSIARVVRVTAGRLRQLNQWQAKTDQDGPERPCDFDSCVPLRQVWAHAQKTNMSSTSSLVHAQAIIASSARVYATPLDNVGTLRNSIVAGCETIRNIPGIHQRIRVSMQQQSPINCFSEWRRIHRKYARSIHLHMLVYLHTSLAIRAARAMSLPGTGARKYAFQANSDNAYETGAAREKGPALGNEIHLPLNNISTTHEAPPSWDDPDVLEADWLTSSVVRCLVVTGLRTPYPGVRHVRRVPPTRNRTPFLYVPLMSCRCHSAIRPALHRRCHDLNSAARAHLAGGFGSRAGRNGRFPRKTRPPAALTGTNPTCEDPGVTRSEIEPVRWSKLLTNEGFSKESARAFKNPRWHSPEVISGNHGNPKLGWPDQDSNPGPPKSEPTVSLLASHQGDPGSIPGRTTPDFRLWEACRTIPLIGGSSRVSPAFPSLSFRRCSILISNTRIGSQDLDVKSRPVGGSRVRACLRCGGCLARLSHWEFFNKLVLLELRQRQKMSQQRQMKIYTAYFWRPCHCRPGIVTTSSHRRSDTVGKQSAGSPYFHRAATGIRQRAGIGWPDPDWLRVLLTLRVYNFDRFNGPKAGTPSIRPHCNCTRWSKTV